MAEKGTADLAGEILRLELSRLHAVASDGPLCEEDTERFCELARIALAADRVRVADGKLSRRGRPDLSALSDAELDALEAQLRQQAPAGDREGE